MLLFVYLQIITRHCIQYSIETCTCLLIFRYDFIQALQGDPKECKCLGFGIFYKFSTKVVAFFFDRYVYPRQNLSLYLGFPLPYNLPIYSDNVDIREAHPGQVLGLQKRNFY